MEPGSIVRKGRVQACAGLLAAVGALAAAWALLVELRQGAAAADELRARESAQVVRLFVERNYPGEWNASKGRLARGGSGIDAVALRSALSEYLPPDAKVAFSAGSSPPAVGWARLPIGDAKDGTIGWISIASASAARARQAADLRYLALFALACAGFLVSALLCLPVLRLSSQAAALAIACGGLDGASRPRLSRSDPLTGMPTRLGIETELSNEAARLGLTYVAMLDIDGFGAIEDDRGREEGDRVLVALARAMLSTVRGADLCGRWGGDQFIVLYRGLAVQNAYSSAERLRGAVERIKIGPADSPLRVTVTIGLAEIGAAGYAAAAEAAEHAMLLGKAEGRNRVVLAG